MKPPKNHFHGFNFREIYYSAILYRIIYNFANLKKSQKERKLLASKVSSYTVDHVRPHPQKQHGEESSEESKKGQ